MALKKSTSKNLGCSSVSPNKCSVWTSSLVLARNWNQDSVEAEGRQKQSWFYQRVLVSAGNKQKQSLPKDKSALTPASRIQIETRSGFVQESDSFCVAKFSVNTFFQGDNDHDVSLIVQKIEQTRFFFNWKLHSVTLTCRAKTVPIIPMIFCWSY